jgi:DNA-binding transcriptional regulator GbsR (MarR family)
MGDDNGFLRGPITRLFEKVAKWIGLSTNAGPVLAALFMESYETGNRMSSDDICKATGYSRANAGLIISQLEALGVIEGQRDYDQTGRGRKRVLYAIDGNFGEIFNLGVMSLMDRLGAMMKDIRSIEDLRRGREDGLAPMLKDIRKVIQERIDTLETVSSAKVTL